VSLADLLLSAGRVRQRRPTVAVPGWAAEIVWRLEHVRAVITGARPPAHQRRPGPDNPARGITTLKYSALPAWGSAARYGYMAWCANRVGTNPTIGGYRILATSRIARF
jgi:hypothetical protein